MTTSSENFFSPDKVDQILSFIKNSATREKKLHLKFFSSLKVHRNFIAWISLETANAILETITLKIDTISKMLLSNTSLLLSQNALHLRKKILIFTEKPALARDNITTVDGSLLKLHVSNAL